MDDAADMKIEDVRRQILAAARERFDRYGFGKTTMAEIARDCGMSAANLYRYFASKSEIGAGIAIQWFADTERRMAELVETATGSPEERLQALIRFRIDLVAELVSASPHIDELVDHVCTERLDLIAAHKERCHAIIAGILRHGVETGDFAVADCMKSAATVSAATIKFYYPDFIRVCDRDELIEEARRVVALLISGIARRDGMPGAGGQDG